jgi:hypothetical protein
MKFSEIAGYTVTSTLVTYYMLKNIGDHISFVADTETIWPFPSGTDADLEHYRAVTELITDE